MKGKLAVLGGFGAGYVLGTRAGRARYEQIKRTATQMWQDPRVQTKKTEATEAVKHTVMEQGQAAKEKIQQKVHDTVQSRSGHDTSSEGGSGAGAAGMSGTGMTGTGMSDTGMETNGADTGGDSAAPREPHDPSWPA